MLIAGAYYRLQIPTDTEVTILGWTLIQLRFFISTTSMHPHGTDSTVI